jgi:hypothetical protein
VKFFIAIIILVVVSIIGTRLTFLNRRLPLGFRNILFTGTEYIFIGLLLGSGGMGIIDDATRKQLEPFLIFGLTWIGFLFGLQFDRRQLRKIHSNIFLVTFLQSLVTFITVSVFIYWILTQTGLVASGTVLFVGLIMGSAASCTAQSALAIAGRTERPSKPVVFDLLRFISGLDGLFALGFFTLAVILFPGQILGLDWSIFNRLILLCLVGVIPAMILFTLSRVRFSQEELMLFLIGVILLAGGAAQTLKQPPILAGFICGAITANLSRHSLRAMSMLLKAEKSIYIVLLILMGAGWNLGLNVSLLIGLGYFLVRFMGKITGMFLATRIWNHGGDHIGNLGAGLISDGGFSVAIIMSFWLQYPASADPIMTIVILSLFLSELIAPGAIVYIFKRSEIKSRRN